MKINNNSKYISYVILFIIFILIKVNYVLQTGEIDEISFKALSISKACFPFGILKETALNDVFLPMYYFIIALFRHELLIKIFNAIVALGNICVLFLIGKKLINKNLGIFLGLFLSLNHFFLYYTGLIAPYCLIFLIQSCTINFLLDYIRHPNKKNFIRLNICNCLLVFADTFGFAYVLAQLAILHLIGEKKKRYKKFNLKLLSNFFVALLIVFPILIVQYFQNAKIIISDTGGIGFNFSTLYLLINEYFTPYLSFYAPEFQSKTLLGMLYSFFLNPDIKNLNSLKILITIFYTSILPLIVISFAIFKSCFKSLRLKILFYISSINFAIMFALLLFSKNPIEPIYFSGFFLTIIILMGYGIFAIKDKWTKIILLFLLLITQAINPEINSFKIVLNEKFALINPINQFIKKKEITSSDLIIMPYMGHFAKLYYGKNHNIFDFDYKYLQTSKKDGFIKNLCNKKAGRINKNNIHFLMNNYLQETQINGYLAKYFINNLLEKEDFENRIILVIDKLNSKPLSKSSILKCANNSDYSSNLRKINFQNADLEQNKSKILLDAIKSKTLFNFIAILSSNFKLSQIVEYKKMDNEYYEIQSTNNPYRALSSFDSDYVFFIFTKI